MRGQNGEKERNLDTGEKREKNEEKKPTFSIYPKDEKADTDDLILAVDQTHNSSCPHDVNRSQ